MKKYFNTEDSIKFNTSIINENLIFIEKVEKGLDQLNSGQTITHEQVKQRIKQWQK